MRCCARRARPPYLAVAADTVFEPRAIERFAELAAASDGATAWSGERTGADLVARREGPRPPRTAAGQRAVRAPGRVPARSRRRRHGLCYPGRAHARPDVARRRRARELPVPAMSESDAYDFFREGQKRLRSGLTAQATVPLEKAKRLEPDEGVDPRGARHRLLPPGALARRGAGVPHDRRRPFTDGPLRALRARPCARAPGKDRGGERSLQARELDEAGLGDVLVAHL